MPVRQKTSVRLDPEIISLGRRLAKKDFGSEQKFGLLIENAIRSYHARQVQPVEASALLSATEEALLQRIEKQVDEMGVKTVERVANLIAKSSYETTLSNIILEQLFTRNDKNKSQLETFRSMAAQRMRNRFDKESAEKISSLVAENETYEKKIRELEELRDKLNRTVKQREEQAARFKDQYDQENKRVIQEVNRKADLEDWTNGLIKYIQTNSGFMKSASKLLEEYMQQHPKPKG